MSQYYGSSQYYPSYPQSSAPMNMPRKPGYYPSTHQAQYSRMSVSPPEAPESSTASGPSYDPSGSYAASYAGSASEYDTSTGSASSIDLMDYMSDRLQSSYNPMPLDRSLATQAQTSGELNAKTRQLMELQQLAASRMAGLKADFADGMRTAKEVQQDLEWTQKRVSSINQRAARKYPKEYQIASQRYPAPVDY